MKLYEMIERRKRINMKLIKWILFGLFILLIIIPLIYPIINNPLTPEWVKESRSFLFDIGKSIKLFSDKNNGVPPTSLKDLYPKYTSDIRVTKDHLLMVGEEVSVNYKRPQKLGNRKDVIIKIRLNRKDGKNKYNKNLELYGNLSVRGIM